MAFRNTFHVNQKERNTVVNTINPDFPSLETTLCTIKLFYVAYLNLRDSDVLQVLANWFVSFLSADVAPKAPLRSALHISLHCTCRRSLTYDKRS